MNPSSPLMDDYYSMENGTGVMVDWDSYNSFNDSWIWRSNCSILSPMPNSINVIAYCYVLPAVCAIGILGNIANLITLSSGRLKAVSYMYLRGLGVADLLCMIFVLIFVSFEIINASAAYRRVLNSYWVAWYRAHLVLPLINWTVSAGILIVVALTLERYISIAWPILFREWNSPRRATIIITLAYVLSLALYIPMCWQNEAVPLLPDCLRNYSGGKNDTFSYSYSSGQLTNWSRDYEQQQGSNMGWTVTDNKVLLGSRGYIAYKSTREALLKVIPIVAITFLNIQIIVAFKKVRNRRRRLHTNSQNSNEQRSLLFLLAGIVVLFFICNIPAAMNLVFISEDMKLKQSYIVFRAVANLLEITNHALNFYNFCLCSSDYRQTFFQKFPCVKRMQESAEDIKRRVSNSVAKVQANRGTSVVVNNGKCPESARFILSSSLRARTADDGQQRAPLRRALSSDTLVRLDHCQLKDGRGRRFGHHYGASKYCPPGKYLAIPNGRAVLAYKRCDSFQDFFDRTFEPIPEDLNFAGGGLALLGDSYVADDSSVHNAQVNKGDSNLALVNLGFSKGEEDGDVRESSLTSYVSANCAAGLIESDDSDDTPMGTPMATVHIREEGTLTEKDEDFDKDTVSYSSANDIYL